jgi:hypothetical protein
VLRRSRRSSGGKRPIAGAQHNSRRNIFDEAAVAGGTQADRDAYTRSCVNR